MNGIAGILNIITITRWLGICIKRKTAKDGSKDMLWTHPTIKHHYLHLIS